MGYDVAFAVGPLGEFGKDGRLPWPRLPGDMEFFKVLTMPKFYSHIICGNNTFKSLPESYKNSRRFIVLSREQREKTDNAMFVQLDLLGERTLDELGAKGKTIFIGGAWLLNKLPHIVEYADNIFLTEVYGEEADKLSEDPKGFEYVNQRVLENIKQTRFSTLIRDEQEIIGFHSKTTRYW